MIRVRRAAVAVLVAAFAFSVAGCGDSEPEPEILMPDVVGLQLDIALSDISRAGLDKDKVEVVGGGTFGVLDEGNWQVCEQVPEAGVPVDVDPRLVIERDCGFPGDNEQSGAEESPDVEETVEEEAVDEEETVTTEPLVEETKPGVIANGATAEDMAAKYEEHLFMPITDMCGMDGLWSHWSCFYDGVEGTSTYLQVNLTTDGGWTDAELDALALTTGTHWFNFIGCDYPDLSTIVVNINGLDYNVFRYETNADLMCN